MQYEDILANIQPECMKCYFLIRPLKSKLYAYRCHAGNCPARLLDTFWKQENEKYEKMHEEQPEFYP